MGDLPLRTPRHRRHGEPLPHHLANVTRAYPYPKFFQHLSMRGNVLWGISRRFHRLSPRYGQVAHALRTLAPVAIKKLLLISHAAPRLACVKPAASVHPEPGSNSSLYKKLYNS